jgi:hypothetical protein
MTLSFTTSRRFIPTLSRLDSLYYYILELFRAATILKLPPVID